MKCRCASCDTMADCRKAFGKYWNGKSGGGEGCNHKFKYSKVEKIEKEPAAVTSPGKMKQGSLL